MSPPRAPYRPAAARSWDSPRAFSRMKKAPKSQRFQGFSYYADGGTRTRTLREQGILSPRCLPFHHISEYVNYNRARRESQGRKAGPFRRGCTGAGMRKAPGQLRLPGSFCVMGLRPILSRASPCVRLTNFLKVMTSPSRECFGGKTLYSVGASNAGRLFLSSPYFLYAGP